MNMETISEEAFRSPRFIEVASIVAEVDQPFTVTDMTGWSGGAARSSIDRTVKRMASAGLLVSVGTLYSRSPQVPMAFWDGFLALREALAATAKDSEGTPDPQEDPTE